MSVRARLLSAAGFFRASTTRVGIWALSAVLLVVCASAALAVTVTPSASFNYAGVIGATNTIMAIRVPIQISTGAFIYKDVKIQINVDAAGNLTYATALPTATLSPMLSSSNIIAGIYTYSPDNRFGIQVSGPAPIGSGGEAQWSLTAAAGLICVAPEPATFYTGPSLATANSGLAARVKAAGITATQYAFGEVGAEACGQDGNWNQNALIGVTMIGSQLSISSFTHSNGTDTSSPIETVIFNFSK